MQSAKYVDLVQCSAIHPNSGYVHRIYSCQWSTLGWWWSGFPPADLTLLTNEANRGRWLFTINMKIILNRRKCFYSRRILVNFWAEFLSHGGHAAAVREEDGKREERRNFGGTKRKPDIRHLGIHFPLIQDERPKGRRERETCTGGEGGWKSCPDASLQISTVLTYIRASGTWCLSGERFKCTRREIKTQRSSVARKYYMNKLKWEAHSLKHLWSHIPWLRICSNSLQNEDAWQISEQFYDHYSYGCKSTWSVQGFPSNILSPLHLSSNLVVYMQQIRRMHPCHSATWI